MITSSILSWFGFCFKCLRVFSPPIKKKSEILLERFERDSRVAAGDGRERERGSDGHDRLFPWSAIASDHKQGPFYRVTYSNGVPLLQVQGTGRS